MVNVVKLLLFKGANINDFTNNRSTAISLSDSDRIKYILQVADIYGDPDPQGASYLLPNRYQQPDRPGQRRLY